jgi:hypothetical protein
MVEKESWSIESEKPVDLHHEKSTCEIDGSGPERLRSR